MEQKNDEKKGILLGQDGSNAVRNANLLSLLLDIQEVEAKKRRVCARKIMMIKKT